MILLDTCALLWLAEGNSRISSPALDLIENETIVSVSAISALEIGLKCASGKLTLPLPTAEWWEAVCSHHSLNVMLIEPSVYVRSTQLPPIHKDPVDRVIIAAAQTAGATVVTADSHFAAYGVDVVL